MSSFTPRTLQVTLYQGDWQQRVDKARAAVETAKNETRARTLAEEPAAVRLAHEHDELLAQAEAEGSVTVTLRALGRRKWSELVEANPPRTSEDVPEAIRESDANLGVNDQTLGDALVPLSIVELSDPDLSVDDLLDAISSAQFDLLYGAAFALNRGTGSDPKNAPRLLPSLSSLAIGN